MSNKNNQELTPAKDLLNRKEASPGPHPPRTLDHLAFALTMEEGGGIADVLTALHRLRQEFVDWNEIRVARIQEIAKAIGDIPGVERVAVRIREEYNSFFDKKGALTFEFLAAGKPSEIRRVLAQLMPALGRGAQALLLYEFCPGASFPLSDEGLRQARKDGVAGKSVDRNQLARALADSLEPADVCRLIQYWELEATGHPYGEAGKKEMASPAAKKGKKSPPRQKAAAEPKPAAKKPESKPAAKQPAKPAAKSEDAPKKSSKKAPAKKK